MRSPSRLSSRSPPRSFSAVLAWHLPQCVTRTGRIFASKNRSCSGVMATPAATAPGGFSFGASGFSAAPPGLRGNDLRYSASERNPSRSASSRRNIGSIVAAASFMRGELRRKSRYSSSESRPSRSASPSMKIRSGSKAGNRWAWLLRPATCVGAARSRTTTGINRAENPVISRAPLSIDRGGFRVLRERR